MAALATSGPKKSAKTERNRRRRQKRKAKRQQGLADPFTRSAPVTPVVGARNCQAGEGELYFSRRELLKTVTLKSTAQVIAINLTPDSFSVLKNIFGSFERQRWIRLTVEFVSSASAMTSGSVTMGVDWDWTGTAPTTVEGVAAYTPSVTGPVRSERIVMNLPASRLQSRQWYAPNSSVNLDKGPGIVYVATAGGSSTEAEVGFLYVSYETLLSGTRAA